jgi:hypothetical protein
MCQLSDEAIVTFWRSCIHAHVITHCKLASFGEFLVISEHRVISPKIDCRNIQLFCYWKAQTTQQMVYVGIPAVSNKNE